MCSRAVCDKLMCVYCECVGGRHVRMASHNLAEVGNVIHLGPRVVMEMVYCLEDRVFMHGPSCVEESKPFA